MTPDERFERRLVPAVSEATEQFRIGNAADGRGRDSAKMAKQVLQRLASHRISPE
jgi:hypothetical protein